MKENFDDYFRGVYRRVGWNIRITRLSKGMNQSDFAEFCGLSRNQIRHLEDGIGVFRFQNVLKICLALNCDPQIMMKSMEGIKLSPMQGNLNFENGIRTTYFHDTLHENKIRQINLKRESVFEFEMTAEQIDFFIIEGPVFIRTGLEVKEWQTNACIKADGTGHIALINYESDSAEILIIRR